jgi:NTE family protein
MKVKDAVRISMSIPLYFEPVYINNKGEVLKNNTVNEPFDMMMDGGILANFPIWLFDDTTNNKRTFNAKTIGFRIDSPSQLLADKSDHNLAPYYIHSLKDYMSSFYTLILENMNRQQLSKEDWDRTISVSSESIGPKVKRLSKQQKDLLIESGRRSTYLYFNQ